MNINREEYLITPSTYKDSKELEAIITLYQNVFGGEPWNEWWICPDCWRNFPLDFEGECPCCWSELKQYYPDDQLEQYFEELSNNPLYKEVIARTKDEIIIWLTSWWGSTLDDLNASKLCLSGPDFQKMEEKILTLYPDFDPAVKFFYLAEVAVDEKYRWKRFASELYHTLLDSVKQDESKYIIVRTTKKTDVPYKWLKKMWYQDVYDYNDDQQRVILIKILDSD